MKVEQKTIRLTEEESRTLWRAEMLCRDIENEVNKIIDLNDKEKEEMTKELGVSGICYVLVHMMWKCDFQSFNGN